MNAENSLISCRGPGNTAYDRHLPCNSGHCLYLLRSFERCGFQFRLLWACSNFTSAGKMRQKWGFKRLRIFPGLFLLWFVLPRPAQTSIVISSCWKLHSWFHDSQDFPKISFRFAGSQQWHSQRSPMIPMIWIKFAAGSQCIGDASAQPWHWHRPHWHWRLFFHVLLCQQPVQALRKFFHGDSPLKQKRENHATRQ